MKKEIVLTANEKEKFHIRLDFNSIIDPQVDFKSSTVHSPKTRAKSSRIKPPKSGKIARKSQKVDSSNPENIEKSLDRSNFGQF